MGVIPLEEEKTMSNDTDTDQVVATEDEVLLIGDVTEEELLRRARGLVQQRTKTWKVVDPEKHSGERIPRLRRDGMTNVNASG